jgi:pimeloyl-ACP methyl ester carboxylesterase
VRNQHRRPDGRDGPVRRQSRPVRLVSAARRLAVPTLYTSAAVDPYGATSATQTFYKIAPAPAKQLVIVPGTAHGTALLARPALARDITAFLKRHDR